MLTAILMTAILLTAFLLSAQMPTCRRRRPNGMLRSVAGEPRKTQRTMSYRAAPSRFAAFTLVELLVVIGIIAVLMAILLPVLAKARAQANRTVCLSNIRQLGTAILMYCNDNKGWFPTCAYWDSLAYKPYPEDWVHWQSNRNLMDSAVAKHVGRDGKLKELLRCPADSFDGRKAGASIAPWQGPYLYSYGMNAGLAQNVRSGSVRTKLAQWRSPSRKILITEISEKYCTAGAWSYGSPLALRHGTTRFQGEIPGFPEMSRGATVGVNVSAVFLDSHAEGIDDMFALNDIQNRPEAR